MSQQWAMEDEMRSRGYYPGYPHQPDRELPKYGYPQHSQRINTNTSNSNYYHPHQRTKREDLQPSQRCRCCPFGYHIDLDFLRICEELNSGRPVKKIEHFRRSRSKPRRSASQDSEPPPSPPKRSSSMPADGERNRLDNASWDGSTQDVFLEPEKREFQTSYDEFDRIQKNKYYGEDREDYLRIKKYRQPSDTQSLPPETPDAHLSDVESLYSEVVGPTHSSGSRNGGGDSYPPRYGSAETHPIPTHRYGSPEVPTMSPQRFDTSERSHMSPHRYDSPERTQVTPHRYDSSERTHMSPKRYDSAERVQLSPHRYGSADGASRSQLRRSEVQANLQDMVDLSDSNTSISSTVSLNSIQSASGPYFSGSLFTDGSLSGRSTPSLSADMLATVRQQMAAALVRIKHLEEQSKKIPILQSKISSLKDERRHLHMQLKSKQLSDQKTKPKSPDPHPTSSGSNGGIVNVRSANGEIYDVSSEGPSRTGRTLDDLAERLAEFNRDPLGTDRSTIRRETTPQRAVVAPNVHKSPRTRSVAVDATDPLSFLPLRTLLKRPDDDPSPGVKDIGVSVHPDMQTSVSSIQVNMWKSDSTLRTCVTIGSQTDPVCIVEDRRATLKQLMNDEMISQTFKAELFRKSVTNFVENISLGSQTDFIEEQSSTECSDAYTQTAPPVKKKMRSREIQTESIVKEFNSVACDTFVEMKAISTSTERLDLAETFSRGTLTDITQMRHMAVNTKMTSEDMDKLRVPEKPVATHSIMCNTDVIEKSNQEVLAVVAQSHASTSMDSSRHWDKRVGTTYDMLKFVGAVADAKISTDRIISSDSAVSCVIDVEDKGVVASPLMRENFTSTTIEPILCNSSTSMDSSVMVDAEVMCDIMQENYILKVEDKIPDVVKTEVMGLRLSMSDDDIVSESLEIKEKAAHPVVDLEKSADVAVMACILPETKDSCVGDHLYTSDVYVTALITKETDDKCVETMGCDLIDTGIMTDKVRVQHRAVGDSNVRIADVAIVTDTNEKRSIAIGDTFVDLVCPRCVEKKMHSIAIEAKDADISALNRRTIGTNHSVLTRSVGTGSSSIVELNIVGINSNTFDFRQADEKGVSPIKRPTLISRGVGDSFITNMVCENCNSNMNSLSNSKSLSSISSQTDPLASRPAFPRTSPSSIKEISYPATNPHERRRPRSHSFPKIVPSQSLEGKGRLIFPPPPDFSFLKKEVDNNTYESSGSPDTIIKKTDVNGSMAATPSLLPKPPLKDVDQMQGSPEGGHGRQKPSKLEHLCSIEEDKLLATTFANPYFAESSPVDTSDQTAATSKILDSQVSLDESTAASISSIASSSSETETSSSDESSTTSYSTTEGSYDGYTGKINVKRRRRDSKEKVKEQQRKIAQRAVKPQKVPLSPSSLKACKLINKHLAEKKDMDDKDVSALMKSVLREWFLVSSQKSSEAAHVQGYLLSLAEVGTKVIHKIVNSSDANGNTALHYSISHANFDIVDTLLDSGVCVVNQTNKAGYTAIMLTALASIKDEKHWKVVDKLFQMGDVNMKASQAGQTALMLAVSHGKDKMAELLINAGADANIQDEDGSTALMCASEHGHLDIVRRLLQADADPSILDSDSSSAFSIAMERGHKAIGVLLYAHTNFSKSSPKKRSNSSSPGSSFLNVANHPSPTRSASSLSLTSNHDNMQIPAQAVTIDENQSRKVYLRSRSLSPSSRASFHSLRDLRPHQGVVQPASLSATPSKRKHVSSASPAVRSSSKSTTVTTKPMSVSLSSLSVSSVQSGMSTSNTSVSSAGSPSTFQRGSAARRSGSRNREGGATPKLAAAVRKGGNSSDKYKSV